MTRTTLILVALALASSATAYSLRPLPPASVAFEDTGELLVPGFTDPSAATSLSVVAWDETEAKVARFAVEQREGKWVIPSHHDYPADGTERMGKAAASFIDVRRDVYYGDKPEDHAKFGVVDPEAGDAPKDARGRRVTIKDATGGTLVDVVVGKRVEGKDGLLYVREAESKRVYGVRMALDISTAFTDWVEKDLLRLERSDVQALVYDPYTVDETQGKVTGFAPVRMVKAADSETWTADAQTPAPAGKQLASGKVASILSAIDGLRLAGVRPRPQMLTQLDLTSRGFFFVPETKRLYGNEGEVRVETKDGVVYVLYFGEVTYDSGLALTAGGPPTSDEDAEAAAAEGKEANRYVFVDVIYDPTRAAGASAAQGAAAPAPDPEVDARVKALQARFDAWFFVISDANFKRIHVERDSLFEDPPASPPAAAG
jgi:hypothetical protein